LTALLTSWKKFEGNNVSEINTTDNKKWRKSFIRTGNIETSWEWNHYILFIIKHELCFLPFSLKPYSLPVVSTMRRLLFILVILSGTDLLCFCHQLTNTISVRFAYNERVRWQITSLSDSNCYLKRSHFLWSLYVIFIVPF